MKSWHYEPHTADIRVIIAGSSLAELYESGAAALYDITKPALSKHPHTQQTLSLSAETAELLLVDFLSEVLYLLEVDRHVIIAYEWTESSAHSLTVTLTIAPCSHLAGVAVKAITYHELTIEKQNGILTTPLIFDI